MSEADDALREMAANRGCKLVRSRRRKPGGDFGRFGIKDAATGREVLGFGPDGLTATREEVQSYLRGGLTASWKRSLIAAVPDAPGPAPARKRKPAAEPPPRPAEPTRATKVKRRPKPKAPPPPELMVREARPKDSAAIAALIVELGYDVAEADVRRRLGPMRKAGEPPLVADQGGVVGCLTWHVTPVLHRPRPVGRITLMVVAPAARGGGIGRRLLAEVEGRLRDRGCGLVEVTSNIKRMRAHAFYERQDFERTSYRFAKMLD